MVGPYKCQPCISTLQCSVIALGDPDPAEHDGVRLATRIVDAVHARRPELLDALEVHLVQAHARRDGPDVATRHTSELTPPAQSHGQCAQKSQNLQLTENIMNLSSWPDTNICIDLRDGFLIYSTEY